jgi:ketosteroid isomerase-like protein
MEDYAANIVQDSLMVNFGAMGDPIIGWRALKEVMEGQNAALSETTIDVRDLRIHVAPSGQFAWATCLWDLKAKMGEEPLQLPVRCTWVLEKQANGWKIIHFHKSVAMV